MKHQMQKLISVHSKASAMFITPKVDEIVLTPTHIAMALERE